MKKPTVASLFSGAGGMDLGFVKAGFDIIWANDNFEDAVKTYENNIGKHIVLGDIENINIDSIPDVDVVIGGFPCQGFSVANTKRFADDGRNKLYKHFVRIISQKQPKIFVGENVKGILNLEKGGVFKIILQDFSEAGYSCRYALLNAANYGVPQSRERVIIIGVRKDLNVNIQLPPPITHSKTAQGNLRKYVSIGEVLADIPDPDGRHDLKNHIYSKYKSKFNGYISNRKVDPSKPSPTITARGDEKGGAMIINHPYRLRRLSCRELAVIQSFPLNFEFCGSMTSIYRQIGNAVPFQMAYAVASSIMSGLMGSKNISSTSSSVPERIQARLFV